MQIGHGLSVAAAALGLAAASLPAQTNVAVHEVVVTAARDRRDTARVPANVTVLTADDIRRAEADTVGDALKKLGGIQVRSVTGTPTTQEVTLRGFGENGFGRVLVLLDGCRVNRPDMSNINWLQFPLSNVERVEIVRGPANVLYGDNASAGVINIITRKEPAGPSAQASLDLASFGSTLLRGSAAGTRGGLAARVGAERYESDGYRDRSRFESSAGSASVSGDIGEWLGAELSVAGQAVDSQWPGALTQAQMREDRRQSINPDDDSDSHFLQVRGALRSLLSESHAGELALSYGRDNSEINMASWGSFSDGTLSRYGALPKYVWKSDWLGGANQLVAGVDLYHETLDVDRFSDRAHAGGLLSAAVVRDTVGAYVRNEHNLTPDWILALGGRAESARFSAEADSMGATLFDDNVTHDATAAEASLIRTFADRSKVFAKAATLYRFPFVDEQISYYGYGTDQFYADIDPEEGWSAEAGAETRIGSDWRLGATLYRMALRDEISYNPASFRNENLDDTRHEGVELEVAWRPVGPLSLEANYTYADATFTGGPNDGNKIPLVARHKTTGMAALALPMNLSLDTTVTYVSDAWLGGDVQNTGEKLPSYVVVDSFLRYTAPKGKGIGAYIGVQNLFDEEYETLGYNNAFGDAYYYPAAGRAVKGGIQYRF